MQPRFCYNKRAQETLAAFVNGGRFPHALLLEGPEGSGRRTFAREIAAALFCRGEHKPCGSCNQCRKVLEQNHPDVEYYGGDGSRRSFHIDTIRQLRQMGVFEQISGLLLGTFTELDRAGAAPGAVELALDIAGRPDLPMARTDRVGHGSDSLCLPLVTYCRISKALL